MTRIISSPQRDILPSQSTSPRLILGARQSKTPPRRTWICGSERARRQWLDRSATPRGQHQGSSSCAGIPRHPGRWPAGGGAGCRTAREVSVEQRAAVRPRRRQVGQVLDELPDASLEPHRTNHADLEAESCAEYRAGRCRWRSHTRRLTYWGRAKVLQKQDTLLDAALTVAHAVLKLCRCHPKNARLPGRCAI